MREPNSTPPPKGVRVQQHHKVGNSAAEIMAKHVRGPNRLLPPGNPQDPIPLTFKQVSSLSYHEMLNKVSGIRSIFERLPSALRQRFGNDPEKMLSFTEDPNNRKESVRLGLVPMSDDEYMEISSQAEQERLQAIGRAMRPDPEAQPDYGRQQAPKPDSTPQKGGQGGT